MRMRRMYRVTSLLPTPTHRGAPSKQSVDWVVMGKMVLSYGGILGLAAALLATESLCRSSGPPVSKPEYRDQVCNRMLPYHARLDPQPGNGGYLIETDLQLSSDPARKEFYFSAGQIYRGT